MTKICYCNKAIKQKLLKKSKSFRTLDNKFNRSRKHYNQQRWKNLGELDILQQETLATLSSPKIGIGNTFKLGHFAEEQFRQIIEHGNHEKIRNACCIMSTAYSNHYVLGTETVSLSEIDKTKTDLTIHTNCMIGPDVKPVQIHVQVKAIFNSKGTLCTLHNSPLEFLFEDKLPESILPIERILLGTASECDLLQSHTGGIIALQYNIKSIFNRIFCGFTENCVYPNIHVFMCYNSVEKYKRDGYYVPILASVMVANSSRLRELLQTANDGKIWLDTDEKVLHIGGLKIYGSRQFASDNRIKVSFSPADIFSLEDIAMVKVE